MWTACLLTRRAKVDHGRALPAEFAKLDLTDIGAHGEVPLVRGGSPQARWYQLSVAALNAPFEQEGLLSAGEAEEIIDRLNDPGFCDFGPAWVGCWGRRRVLGAGS